MVDSRWHRVISEWRGGGSREWFGQLRSQVIGKESNLSALKSSPRYFHDRKVSIKLRNSIVEECRAEYSQPDDEVGSMIGCCCLKRQILECHK